MTPPAIDLSHGGTPYAQWLPVIESMPAWHMDERLTARLVVVAPHPDDETIGAGGAIAAAARLDVPVVIVAVTDGEAADVPGSSRGLIPRRSAERAAALDILAPGGVDVERLRVADGCITDHRGELAASLRSIVRPGDLLLTTIDSDGHPDHDACGSVVRGLAHEERQISAALYPVWAWHWHDPRRSVLASAGRRFDLTDDIARAKAQAMECFVSQTEGDAAVLPSQFVDRLSTPCEVMVPL
ncbi:MAG: lmbE-like protein [Ilumatobacteraceae bacterium]|nr:lmbE-like protein [Ilumatobacteraceae bacterium]